MRKDGIAYPATHTPESGRRLQCIWVLIALSATTDSRMLLMNTIV